MSDYGEKPSAPPQGGDQFDYPPPQPPAYPQPQAYPPPQPAAYPPPQPAAYPPPQAAYPPPQYNNNPNQPLLQNQPGGTTVIINEHVVHDHYLIITVIVVIWSFFCGLAYLLCSVPALILSIMARDDERAGDYESARTKQRLAIILDIVAIVTSIVLNVTIVILAATV